MAAMACSRPRSAGAEGCRRWPSACAYSSGVEARKPVSPFMMISARGPPLLCARGMRPAACVEKGCRVGQWSMLLQGGWGGEGWRNNARVDGTDHVLDDADAEVLVPHGVEPHARAAEPALELGKGGPHDKLHVVLSIVVVGGKNQPRPSPRTQGKAQQEIPSTTRTSIPSSATSRRSAATRASSSGPRQLPSITSFTSSPTLAFLPFPFPPAACSCWRVRRKRAKARTWRGWFFSGRNWPTERTMGSRGVSGKSCVVGGVDGRGCVGGRFKAACALSSC